MIVQPHLFIPGPTNIPEPVRKAMNLRMEDMRAPDFPKFTLPLFEDLKKVFKMKDGRVFLFPSSGTGAWESAISNTLNAGDKVLMSRFGQFSLLWVDMAERLGLDVNVIDVEWGEGVPVEKYAEILAADQGHERSKRFLQPTMKQQPVYRATSLVSAKPSTMLVTLHC